MVQAGFFVTTGNLDKAGGEGGEARIAAYVAAGHVVGNHSHSHSWLWNGDAQAYVADLDKAEAWLAGRPGKRPWYRFPYLDEGRDTERRDAVRAALKERGLMNAYVTIDDYDWAIDDLARKAMEAGRPIDRAALGELYVETLVGTADFYDAMGRDVLGRAPAQVMLLHETDLAALFIADLAKALRADGWTIVTIDEAYHDPIARSEPDDLPRRRAARRAGADRRARSREPGLRTNQRARACAPVRGPRDREGAQVTRARLFVAAGPRRRARPALSAQDPAQAPARVDHARMLAADAEPGQWMGTGRTYDEQRFSPLDQINAGNVRRLGLAWFADIATTRGMEASPLAIDGVLYNVQPWNVVTAYDGRTGKVLWSYDPQVPLRFGRLACCDIVSRGLAAWQGRIYVATLDGRLIALDAKSGEPVWSTLTVDNSKNYTITGAPRVFDGKVLIGNGGAEVGVRGYVSAYDATSGKLLWRFYTVPGNPADGFESPALEKAAATWTGEWWKAGGGGTVWDGISYDPELKTVYIGTGNGSPWVRKWRSPGGGDNLFLASIVALDAETGAYKWHYQTVPGEEWDYTATQQMILAEIEVGGKPRKVLMQAPKNGFFYVLDRQTGELISAEKIAPINWATSVDMKTGRPVENPQARYGTTPVMVSPGAGGAHNWNPMAYSPLTGLVYVPVTETYMAYAAAETFAPGARRSAPASPATTPSARRSPNMPTRTRAAGSRRGTRRRRRKSGAARSSRRAAAACWSPRATLCSRAPSARPSPPTAPTPARRCGTCRCSRSRSPRRSPTPWAARNISLSTPAGAAGSRTSSARSTPSCSCRSPGCWCSSSAGRPSCRRCPRPRSRCPS